MRRLQLKVSLKLWSFFWRASPEAKNEYEEAMKVWWQKARIDKELMFQVSAKPALKCIVEELPHIDGARKLGFDGCRRIVDSSLCLHWSHWRVQSDRRPSVFCNVDVVELCR